MITNKRLTYYEAVCSLYLILDRSDVSQALMKRKILLFCRLTHPGECSPQVEDPRIARLVDGRVLVGRDLGITTIQVCPCSSSLISDSACHIELFQLSEISITTTNY